jgi:AraC-like DNA-binding protein
MKLLFLFYYYLLANGLVLFLIGIFRIKKNPATKYYFLQYLILLILVAEFVVTEYVFRHIPFYCYSDFPIRFLITPFIYLYVCKYTNPKYKPDKKTLCWLFIPAFIELICFTVICFYYYRHPHSFEDRLKIANNSAYYIIRTFLALLFNITVVYFAYSKIKIFSWNIFKVLSNFSQLKFIWLKIILAISVFLWIYWLITFSIEVIFPIGPVVIYMYNILYLLIALVVLVFGYFAILKPYVAEAYIRAMEEINTIEAEQKPDIIIKEQIEKELSNADELGNAKEPDIFKQYFVLLEAYINKTKAFTNADITLVEIAKKLNTNSFNISKAIKIYSKEGSFYEYINRYRLIYFLGLLANPDSDQFTITALALKSGFTSSTTLNKYCKKITGTTPAKAKVLLAHGKTAEDLLNG